MEERIRDERGGGQAEARSRRVLRGGEEKVWGVKGKGTCAVEIFRLEIIFSRGTPAGWCNDAGRSRADAELKQQGGRCTALLGFGSHEKSWRGRTHCAVSVGEQSVLSKGVHDARGGRFKRGDVRGQV